MLPIDEADETAGSHEHPVDPGRVAQARERLDAARTSGGLDELTQVLGLLADPTRAFLLFALDAVEELCVGDLALALASTEDAVGYGLRQLRAAGLVVRRRQGRMVFYRLADLPAPLLQLRLQDLLSLSTRSIVGPEPS